MVFIPPPSAPAGWLVREDPLPSLAARTAVRCALTALLALAVGLAGAATAAAQAPGCTKPSKLGISMIVDDSASMGDNDPDELRGEGLSLALDLLPNGAMAAAGSFDSSSREFFGPSEV